MLTLDFINVGYGDAILIRESGIDHPFTMLVDAGDSETGADRPDSPRLTAAAFLQREQVRHIDLIVLSHLHRDHQGGLLDVLDAADCNTMWVNYLPPARVLPERIPDATPDGPLPVGVVHSARQFLTVLDKLDRRGACVIEKTAPERNVRLTERLTLELDVCDRFLHRRYRRTLDALMEGKADRYELTLLRTYLNLTSLRLTLIYGGRRIALPADVYAGYWQEEELLPCHILKVPHHGCLAGVSETLLNKLSPEIAVVCVSDDRRDDRPNEEAVRLLKRYAKTVLYTDAVSVLGGEPISHASVHIELPE